MTIIGPESHPVKPECPDNVHTDQPDPVATFAKLVACRRRHDHRAAAPLVVELRRLGWVVVATSPAGAGRRS